MEQKKRQETPKLSVEGKDAAVYKEAMHKEAAAGKENLGYKNSVFVDLFHEDQSADENDIALYNALHKEKLPAGTKIRRFRVDDILYMNFKNDISFGIEDKLIIFGDHQSTINLNMPLRSLMYAGRAYEQLVPVKERY